ncbi:MAG: twin-arginine translocase TatA/TatE family subunit [Gemmatimonadetes bacterium]|nr:twin-arginine translocase TatA/TatE family subunit [Gemmatimonadota bacterium]|tara:strand:+ start:10355 stop:10522 length:168 start_codon:yes stop_codon:yes gene_type:complete
MAVIGFWEVALMLGVLMIFFGAKKLPQLARGLGSGIRNFKGELSAPAEESKDGEE